MITLFLLIFHFIFLNDHVKARRILAESSEGVNPPSQDPISNSQPSLPVVICILSILFCLSLMILLYAKFRHSTSSSSLHQIQDGLFRSKSLASGIDKKVIESLPFFRFSSLKGSREGLECAVCLAKFQDIEILRLLPKCKHAFHIDCIDLWLEKHSTCPLCRQKVGPNDFSQLPYSDSLRFLWNKDQRDHLREESNVELYVEREENLHGSSRFSIGSISLRRLCDNCNKDVDEELMPIQHMDSEYDENKKELDKLKHKINLVSDVVFMNRWSNVSSSDLMFLNSEMVCDASSARFSSLNSRNYERNSKALNQNEKRSMSEITVHQRLKELTNRDIILATSGPKKFGDEKYEKAVAPKCWNS